MRPGLELCVSVPLDALMVRLPLHSHPLVLGDVSDLGLKALEEKGGGGDGEEREEGPREINSLPWVTSWHPWLFSPLARTHWTRFSSPGGCCVPPVCLPLCWVLRCGPGQMALPAGLGRAAGVSETARSHFPTLAARDLESKVEVPGLLGKVPTASSRMSLQVSISSGWRGL